MGLFSKAKEIREQANPVPIEPVKKGLLDFAKIKRKNRINHFIRACNIILINMSRYMNNKNSSDEMLIKKIEWFDLQVEATEQELKQMGIEGPKTQRLRLLLKYFSRIDLKKGQIIKEKMIANNIETLKKKKENENISEAELRQKAANGADAYKNNLSQLSINIMEYKNSLMAIKKAI